MFLNSISVTRLAKENMISNMDSLCSRKLISSKDMYLIPSDLASAIWSSVMLVSGQLITRMQAFMLLMFRAIMYVNLKYQTFAVSS